jgi:hypothetical protein
MNVCGSSLSLIANFSCLKCEGRCCMRRRRRRRRRQLAQQSNFSRLLLQKQQLHRSRDLSPLALLLLLLRLPQLRTPHAGVDPGSQLGLVGRRRTRAIDRSAFVCLFKNLSLSLSLPLFLSLSCHCPRPLFAIFILLSAALISVYLFVRVLLSNYKRH